MQNRNVLLLAAVIAFAALAASAQDAAVVNAKTVVVKLDNAKTRVLDSALEPGEKEQMHSHPASIIYIISGGRIRNHNADGTTSETDIKAGDVIYREPLTHWAENIGTTRIHLILVELKPAP
jgi:quercetin dioxygenase-like cupin family protein